MASLVLDLGTKWRWVVNFMPYLHYPNESNSITRWVVSWVGPEAGMDILEKIALIVYWVLNPGLSWP